MVQFLLIYDRPAVPVFPVGIHQVADEAHHQNRSLATGKGSIEGHEIGQQTDGDEEDRRRAQNTLIDEHHHGREERHQRQGQAVIVDDGSDCIPEGHLGISAQCR